MTNGSVTYLDLRHVKKMQKIPVFEIGPKESELPFATKTSLTGFRAGMGRGGDNMTYYDHI